MAGPMGLTVPVTGVTPGGLGGYSDQINADLALIETHNHTTGQGNLVPAAGLNINGNLSFNGNNLTSAGSIFVTNLSATNLIQSIAAAGFNITGIGTLSATSLSATSFTGNLSLAGGGIFETAASTSLILKGNAISTGVGVIIDNVTTAGSSGTLISVRTGGTEYFRVDGQGNMLWAGVLLQNFSLGTAILRSQVPATGVAWAIDNTNTLTGAGKILSLRNNGEQAYFDIGGGLTMVGSGTLQTTLASTPITVKGNGPVGGPALIVDNVAAVGSGNKMVSFRSNAGESAYITGSGGVSTATHFLSNGVAPTPAAFAAGWGTPAGPGIVGGDAAGILTFTSGTGALIAANTLLFNVTLSFGYTSASFVVMVSEAQVGTALAVAGTYYAVPVAANIFQVYCSAAVTPANATQYKFQYMTMGAGVAS